MPAKKKKPEQWKDSEAKRLLREDIIAGVVLSSITVSDVYKMRPEYEKWPFENFQTNLRSLRKKIATDYERMQTDCEAYGLDQEFVKTMLSGDHQPKSLWHKSEARKLLKVDVNEGKHLQMKPSELRATRVEYLTFPLKVFRDHIYQEVDSRAKRLVRFEKKKTRIGPRIDLSNSDHPLAKESNN